MLRGNFIVFIFQKNLHIEKGERHVSANAVTIAATDTSAATTPKIQ
jgi:hypothetical protein